VVAKGLVRGQVAHLTDVGALLEAVNTLGGAPTWLSEPVQAGGAVYVSSTGKYTGRLNMELRQPGVATVTREYIADREFLGAQDYLRIVVEELGGIPSLVPLTTVMRKQSVSKQARAVPSALTGTPGSRPLRASRAGVPGRSLGTGCETTDGPRRRLPLSFCHAARRSAARAPCRRPSRFATVRCMVRSAALWSASAMASLMVALDLDAACGRVAAVFDVDAVSLRAADPEALVLDH
jgi:hypothetical protein